MTRTVEILCHGKPARARVRTERNGEPVIQGPTVTHRHTSHWECECCGQKVFPNGAAA